MSNSSHDFFRVTDPGIESVRVSDGVFATRQVLTTQVTAPGLTVVPVWPPPSYTHIYPLAPESTTTTPRLSLSSFQQLGRLFLHWHFSSLETMECGGVSVMAWLFLFSASQAAASSPHSCDSTPPHTHKPLVVHHCSLEQCYREVYSIPKKKALPAGVPHGKGWVTHTPFFRSQCMSSCCRAHEYLQGGMPTWLLHCASWRVSGDDTLCCVPATVKRQQG